MPLTNSNSSRLRNISYIDETGADLVPKWGGVVEEFTGVAIPWTKGKGSLACHDRLRMNGQGTSQVK